MRRCNQRKRKTPQHLKWCCGEFSCEIENGLNAVFKPFLSRSFVIEKVQGEYGALLMMLVCFWGNSFKNCKETI